jgi:hypothetical protein
LQTQKEKNSAFIGGNIKPSLKHRLALEAARSDRTVLGQLRLILRERYAEADDKESASS